MYSAVLFIIVSIVVVFAVAATKIPISKFKDYFLGDNIGLGILKGIVLAICFGALMVFGSYAFSEETPWYLPEKGWEVLPEGSVFLGMDETKKISPMCSGEGVDDRWTSNLGVRVALFRTADQKFTFGGKYTHHSCAYGVDSKSYDAWGVEMSYKLW